MITVKLNNFDYLPFPRIIVLLEEHLEANSQLTLLLVKQSEHEQSEVKFKREESNVADPNLDFEMKEEFDSYDEAFLDEQSDEDLDDLDHCAEESKTDSPKENKNKAKDNILKYESKVKTDEANNLDFSHEEKKREKERQKKRNQRARGKVENQIKSKCEYCLKFLKPRSLITHIKVHHEKDPKYLERIEKATTPKDRICSVCNETFTMSAQQMFHHREKCEFEKTGELKFTCEICGAAFGTSQKCRTHWNSCSGRGKEFGMRSCVHENCDFKTRAQFLMDNHVNIVHLNLPKTKDHVCSYCGKGYNIVSRLNNHIKDVHLNIRPFECEECGKTFTRKARLTDHMDLHKGIMKYPCQYCGRAFGNSGSLCNHKKSCAQSPTKRKDHQSPQQSVVIQKGIHCSGLNGMVDL